MALDCRRHYAEGEAAASLGISPVTLKMLRLAGSIGYVAKGNRAIAYFGFPIADYLNRSGQTMPRYSKHSFQSVNGGSRNGTEVPRRSEITSVPFIPAIRTRDLTLATVLK